MIDAIGIEIGGTKLQVGIGLQDERLLAIARTEIDPSKGAAGIREAIPSLVEEALLESGTPMDEVGGIGVGFGGPVDSKQGLTITSHQVEGWDHFPLKAWLEERFQLPASIQNDASIAGFAEAMLGAGKGLGRVFYMTIGSGIGGGLITNGAIDEGQGLGAAEIGHTWVPDPDTGEPDKLEHICSGWSIGKRAQQAILDGEPSLMVQLADNDVEQITAKTVYEASEQDDSLACSIMEETCTTLAVGICNVIALLDPERVIIGGGVSLMGKRFWDGLRHEVERFQFQPYAGTVEIVPAALKEEVVILGAALLGQKIADQRFDMNRPNLGLG